MRLQDLIIQNIINKEKVTMRMIRNIGLSVIKLS